MMNYLEETIVGFLYVDDTNGLSQIEYYVWSLIPFEVNDVHYLQLPIFYLQIFLRGM